MASTKNSNKSKSAMDQGGRGFDSGFESRQWKSVFYEASMSNNNRPLKKIKSPDRQQNPNSFNQTLVPFPPQSSSSSSTPSFRQTQLLFHCPLSVKLSAQKQSRKIRSKIGFALKKLFDDGVVKREEMCITSKLWHTEHEPEDVPVAFEKTLQDLQLDYLDVYFIHWPVRMKKGTIGMKVENLLPADIPSTWKAVESLYDSGKARATGVCNFSSKKLANLLDVARIPPSINQVESHPKWNQNKLRQFCKSNGIHLSAWSPLGSPGTPWINGKILEHPIVTMVAEKLGKTPAQVTLRWGLQMGYSVLPKSTNAKRIKENFDIFDWSIPDELFAKLSEIEQVRLVKGNFLIGESSPYKTVDDLWDGEV